MNSHSDLDPLKNASTADTSRKVVSLLSDDDETDVLPEENSDQVVSLISDDDKTDELPESKQNAAAPAKKKRKSIAQISEEKRSEVTEVDEATHNYVRATILSQASSLTASMNNSNYYAAINKEGYLRHTIVIQPIDLKQSDAVNYRRGLEIKQLFIQHYSMQSKSILVQQALAKRDETWKLSNMQNHYLKGITTTSKCMREEDPVGTVRVRGIACKRILTKIESDVAAAPLNVQASTNANSSQFSALNLLARAANDLGVDDDNDDNDNNKVSNAKSTNSSKRKRMEGADESIANASTTTVGAVSHTASTADNSMRIDPNHNGVADTSSDEEVAQLVAQRQAAKLESERLQGVSNAILAAPTIDSNVFNPFTEAYRQLLLKQYPDLLETADQLATAKNDDTIIMDALLEYVKSVEQYEAFGQQLNGRNVVVARIQARVAQDVAKHLDEKISALLAGWEMSAGQSITINEINRLLPRVYVSMVQKMKELSKLKVVLTLAEANAVVSIVRAQRKSIVRYMQLIAKSPLAAACYAEHKATLQALSEQLKVFLCSVPLLYYAYSVMKYQEAVQNKNDDDIVEYGNNVLNGDRLFDSSNRPAGMLSIFNVSIVLAEAYERLNKADNALAIYRRLSHSVLMNVATYQRYINLLDVKLADPSLSAYLKPYLVSERQTVQAKIDVLTQPQFVFQPLLPGQVYSVQAMTNQMIQIQSHINSSVMQPASSQPTTAPSAAVQNSSTNSSSQFFSGSRPRGRQHQPTTAPSVAVQSSSTNSSLQSFPSFTGSK